ncbi:hypothetical protein H920_03556 [Fukomys damarensis]|uniref:Uncharacterized protein n=1 Tax=Fukomys damarensis TaxID=885580 RepID=A0A091DSB3_FUKDA|nr:hypothetical protein H920_03556 [Fukomys damarensis]
MEDRQASQKVPSPDSPDTAGTAAKSVLEERPVPNGRRDLSDTQLLRLEKEDCMALLEEPLVPLPHLSQGTRHQGADSKQSCWLLTLPGFLDTLTTVPNRMGLNPGREQSKSSPLEEAGTAGLGNATKRQAEIHRAPPSKTPATARQMSRLGSVRSDVELGLYGQPAGLLCFHFHFTTCWGQKVTRTVQAVCRRHLVCAHGRTSACRLMSRQMTQHCQACCLPRTSVVVTPAGHTLAQSLQAQVLLSFVTAPAMCQLQPKSHNVDNTAPSG